MKRDGWASLLLIPIKLNHPSSSPSFKDDDGSDPALAWAFAGRAKAGTLSYK